MKKLLAAISILFLIAFMSSVVSAQTIALDTDLATEGYQGLAEITDIGPKEEVGVAVYLQGVESLKGCSVKFLWDPDKVEFRASKSGRMVPDDDGDINGEEDVTFAEEENMLGSSLTGLLTIDEEWLVEDSFTGTTTDAAEGLVYFAIFRTLDTFDTTDGTPIKVYVKILDGDGNEKDLDPVFFQINEPVDVKSSTWSEVKKQFKDF